MLPGRSPGNGAGGGNVARGRGVDPEPVPLVTEPGSDRGDDMADRSADEALPALTARSRTPMVLTEGIHRIRRRPDVPERNHCSMTIGSRPRKADGAWTRAPR
ncbi:hypothetical protein B4N89_43745 [Embleya scabrispora]|uniref:Uncharacterized protein n=1 Tax=Embleya scabrispora TaxID=159449 RepID=A0A1T3NKN8_9ACTN|nr:hypothetical protein B4N89_43745 [Embleya scabrispora]